MKVVLHEVRGFRQDDDIRTRVELPVLVWDEMLLGGGERDGVRILRPETIEVMTRNHLPDEMIPILGLTGQGFGLGFAVPAGEEDGTYWWSGVANTYFWIDPAEEIIAFAWTQLQPFGSATIDQLLRPLVYDAILDGN